MLFNTVEFAFFLPIVFILYWFVTNKSLKLQNSLLLIASYVFYGWWDWRFLSLVIFSSFVDYFVGIGLSSTSKKSKRKLLLLLSICVNIGFLGFFKYFNFFAESFADAFTLFGQSFEATRLNIVLPVGISFYTFQTLSYSIDVYKEKLKPTKDIISFFAFVSFFPQLVAGPIERASNLIPQFYKKRKFEFDHAVDGLRQILWGLFKKIVIADNCAYYADQIFANYTDFNGSTLVLGALFFTFQIYGDFSGYSDIAIGTSRLFGFKLMQNFAFPYFSRDIAEFWRRWHISLSTWFRDYLYISLGGSRGGTWMKVRNTFIIFIVSGFWHGANWTFIIWGFLNACYFLPLLLTKNNRSNLDTVAQSRYFPTIKEFFQMGLTFVMSVFAWIFFRANNVKEAFEFILGIFSKSLFNMPYIIEEGTGKQILPKTIFLLIFILIIVEWLGRENQHALEKINTKFHKPLRYLLYVLILFSIFWFGGREQEFIYFQF
jgi:D-alanyl-lipoteichoic acid acyltransferase DltB (MBOAT superfamily)